MADGCVGKTNHECYCANKSNDECFAEFLRQTDPGPEWKEKHSMRVFPADGFKLGGRLGWGALFGYAGKTFIELGAGKNFSLHSKQKLQLVLRGNVGGDLLLSFGPGEAPQEKNYGYPWGGHFNTLVGLGIRTNGNAMFEIGPRLGLSHMVYPHGDENGTKSKTGFSSEGYLGVFGEVGNWINIAGGFLLGGYDTGLQAGYVMGGVNFGTYSL